MASAAITTLKLVLSFAIVAYVVAEVDADAVQVGRAIDSVAEGWAPLAGAFALIAAAVALGIVRWLLIARMVGLTFPARRAFRLGSMSFALGFAGLGAVGGDLFKAVSLARDNPQDRVSALVSVAADRIVGLFALLLFASAAAFSLDHGEGVSGLETLKMVVISVTALASLTVAGALGSERLTDAVTRQLNRLWPSGSVLHRLAQAIGAYRRQPGCLLLALLMSFCVQALHVLGFCFIALSLPPPAPSLSEQLLIVPLSLVSGAIPLPMGALGVFDYSMSHLSAIVTDGRVAMSQGLLATMTYRLIAALIAILGALLYASSKNRQRLDGDTRDDASVSGSPRRPLGLTDIGDGR